LLPAAAWLPAHHLSRLSCCCACACCKRGGCLLLLAVTQAVTLAVQAAAASAASEMLRLPALRLQAQVLQLLQLVWPAPARPAHLLQQLEMAAGGLGAGHPV
jgi:hypothetical protein